MKLIKYGVCLRRITHDDIELVRTWRNSEFVRQFMHFREYITPEMQENWFRQINNAENFFYMIEYGGEKIGVIHEKNLNRETGTTESGIFVSGEAYLSSFIPVAASLIMIEVNFYLLNGKESYIQILRDNHRSISYNRALGYELCPGQEELELQSYVLTRASFELHTRKLRRAIFRQTGADPLFLLIFEHIDFQSGCAQAFLEFFNRYPYRGINIRVEEQNTIVEFPLDVDAMADQPLIDPSIVIEPIRY